MGHRCQTGSKQPVILYMETLATDENTQMGREVLQLGGNELRATVPTRERGDKTFLCDQQDGGGDGGLLGGVHKAVQCGPHEVRGSSADDR